nr:hypothetical protein Itr_chr15CG11210 [Ipomoea trifida]
MEPRRSARSQSLPFWRDSRQKACKRDSVRTALTVQPSSVRRQRWSPTVHFPPFSFLRCKTTDSKSEPPFSVQLEQLASSAGPALGWWWQWKLSR